MRLRSRSATQHEKFLFYRGVGRFQPPLSARLSDEKVTVENRGSDAVPAVFLFENRGGRLGYRNAGALKDAVTLDKPLLDGTFTQLLHDLETTLVAQGLFPKEAQAMVETWRDSWFEEGSRLIYIVPSQRHRGHSAAPGGTCSGADCARVRWAN